MESSLEKPSVSLNLRGFISFLYEGLTEGFVYTPTLDRETGKFKQYFVHVTKLERLEEHIREQSKTTDVYISPAVFRQPSAKKEDFLASNVVYTEFDGKVPEDYKNEPTVIIQSSSTEYLHCYWRLIEPMTNSFDLEEINRGIAFTLGADMSAFDCTQILRPPETHNYKKDLPVIVSAVSGFFYTPKDFSIYQAPDRMNEDSIQLDHIPDVMDVIYKYPLSLAFKEVFTSNPLEGSRSTTYVYLGYLAAEAGLNDEELYSVLRNFDDRISKYRTRADRHRRLLDIIERVRLKYPTQQEQTLEDNVSRLEIYDVVSFDNESFSVEWLIPGLLQSGGNLLLSGPPGVGKTQIALNFAFGLASKRSILDYEAQRACRILFVSCEMGPADLKYFTTSILSRYKEHRDLLKENLFILPLGEPLYLSTTQGQDQILRLAETLALDGVIFDSLGSATDKALTDEESTKNLLDFNDRFRKNMGVFTWYIHHNRKATENNKEPSGLADVYGSQYITARATTVLSLWPTRKDYIKVRELKVRLAAQKEDWFIKRTENLNFEKVNSEEAILTKDKRNASNGNSGFTNSFFI